MPLKKKIRSSRSPGRPWPRKKDRLGPPAFLPFAIIINTSEDDELHGILSTARIYPAKKRDEA